MNFVNTKTTEDLKIPEGIKIPSDKDLETIHSKIQDVIKSGNLVDLTETFNLIE